MIATLPAKRQRTDDENRYEQIVRIMVLMQRVTGRAYCPPLRVLAADLGVCERTVRRYLDAMSRAGVPVPPLFSEYQREAEIS
jgi:predicted DNA-binding transcriptional regulator YafY